MWITFIAVPLWLVRVVFSGLAIVGGWIVGATQAAFGAVTWNYDNNNGRLTVTGDGNDNVIVIRRKSGSNNVEVHVGNGNWEDTGRTHLEIQEILVDGGAGGDSINSSISSAYGFGNLDGVTLLGGDGNDTIDGTSLTTVTNPDHHDSIKGGSGNDVLYGHDGGDCIYGEGGNDTLLGGPGNDLIYSGDDDMDTGTGNDSILGGDDADVLRGQDGNDTIYGDGGNDDILDTGGQNSLFGGAGNDFMCGGDSLDYMFGGDGNDNMDGQGFNDLLDGEGGNDQLFGDSGDDTLRGGWGADTLEGGVGSDLLDHYSLTSSTSDSSQDRLWGQDIGDFSGDPGDVYYASPDDDDYINQTQQ